MLDGIRIIVTLTCLGVASYQDLRERLVDDKIWLIFFPVGIGLLIVDFLLKPPQLFYILCSFCAVSPVVIVVAVLVKMEIVGSADLIAICYIAASMPLYTNHFPIFDLRKLAHPFFPVTVILNSCLMSLAVIPYNLARNVMHLISGRKLFEGIDAGAAQRTMVFLLATPVNTKFIRNRHFIPMEIKNSGRKITVIPKIGNENEVYGKEIWATIGLPMIFLYFISFIFSLIFGGVLL